MQGRACGEAIIQTLPRPRLTTGVLRVGARRVAVAALLRTSTGTPPPHSPFARTCLVGRAPTTRRPGGPICLSQCAS
eukprot:scaffold208470_cov22-Tisochrysis_lutea.AAC.1